jgi:hypothetical protein
MRKSLIAGVAVCTIGFVTLLAAQNIKQELQQKVATVKESVARNQAALRQYTWTEHTDILYKGDVKKTTDKLCRYGPDGKVQKTVLNTSPQKELRGVRKRVVDKKVDELKDYMDRAVALIHQYMPPDPEAMQASYQAGNVMIGQSGPGSILLQFKDYMKPADQLAFTFDSASKAVTKIAIASYLSDQKDSVTLDVTFQMLPDGTNHQAATVLNAPAKDIQVKVQNSNYQRLAQ